MSEERTPADDYREARTASIAAWDRWQKLQDKVLKAERKYTRLQGMTDTAERALLRWVANDD